MWHSCGLVLATWPLDSCSCFVVVIGKNRVFIWSVQSWADSFLFLRSTSDSFISPKSNLPKKKRLLSYTYGCFLISEAEEVQFSSIKTSKLPCIFYSCLNYYWKKGRGNFWRPQFALWRPKIYTWSPVGARINKLISDPAGPTTRLCGLVPIVFMPLVVVSFCVCLDLNSFCSFLVLYRKNKRFV